jgi:2-oxoisovalerate dehydrogenase E2 component (dihydrolipoyl transacylase)
MTESVTTGRREFRLPDVGEGLTEADIVTWRVKPGDTVTVNQIIVDIETAKAVVELPSPYAGVVAALLVPEGQTVDVGTPIIAVDVPGAAPPPGGPPPAAAAAPAAGPAATPADDPAAIAAAGPRPSSEDLIPPVPPAEERQAVLVGYGVKAGATTRRARKAPAGNGSVAETAPATGNGAPGGHASVLAKPPVRKLARELGVDLGGLAGSGPGGSITRNDVQQAAGAPAPAAAGPGAAPGAAGPAVLREERIPIRGVRKHTAAAVAASARQAPHVTEFLQVDVEATVEAVRRLRDLPEFAGVRVSPLLLVARALLTAVARHPMINSTWDEDAQEIVVKHYVNLGIAAATERGLVVPTIKGAHLMGLPALARALAGLADTARAGQASPADLTGGTITITNVGVFGVDAGTPIITPPEAAILAIGQIKDAPWVVDGQLAVRKVTTLSLSFDHRIIDGDLGSAVLRDIGAMLHDPLRMLAWG